MSQVKSGWLAERLAMGYETRLRQAVAELDSSREPSVLTLKKKLVECGI
jgi:hypothetical protein